MNFQQMTIRELRQYCKDNQVEGYSKYVNNKKALVAYLEYAANLKETFEEPVITKLETIVSEQTIKTADDIVIRTDGNDYVNFGVALLLFIVVAACWLTIVAGQLTRCLVDFIYVKFVELTSNATSSGTAPELQTAHTPGEQRHSKADAVEPQLHGNQDSDDGADS